MTTQSNKPNETTQSSTSYGAPITSNVLDTLWERARPHLTAKDLEWFEGASAQAEFMASTMQEVIEGIGCLLNEGQSGKSISGSFLRGGDTANLLFFISQNIDCLRGMISIGANASAR